MLGSVDGTVAGGPFTGSTSYAGPHPSRMAPVGLGTGWFYSLARATFSLFWGQTLVERTVQGFQAGTFLFTALGLTIGCDCLMAPPLGNLQVARQAPFPGGPPVRGRG